MRSDAEAKSGCAADAARRVAASDRYDWQGADGKGCPSKGPATTMRAVGDGTARTRTPAATRPPWGQGARMPVVWKRREMTKKAMMTSSKLAERLLPGLRMPPPQPLPDPPPLSPLPPFPLRSPPFPPPFSPPFLPPKRPPPPPPPP
eukprot:2516815-Prymnesium_polylepis.1